MGNGRNHFGLFYLTDEEHQWALKVAVEIFLGFLDQYRGCKWAVPLSAFDFLVDQFGHLHFGDPQ